MKKRIRIAVKTALSKIFIVSSLFHGFGHGSDSYHYITRSLKSNSDIELARIAQKAIDKCDTTNNNCSKKAIDIKGLSINWDNSIKVDEHVAVCSILYFSDYAIDRTIKVHPAVKHMSDDEMYILVMHEIMHCLLNYDHIEDETNAMNPYIIDKDQIDLLGGPDIIIDNAFNNHILNWR